jgi:hypothetical protein
MRPDVLSGMVGGGGMPVSEILHGVFDFAQQMPAIGDLNGGRCTLAYTVGISAGAVACDDLDASRRSVSGLIWTASRVASRAPASPPSAKPR